MKYPLFFLLFIFIMAFAAPAGAQLHWKPVESGYGNIPNGFRLFRSTDSLHGHASVAYYVEVDISDRHFQFRTVMDTSRPATASAFYERLGKPLLIVNAGYFSPETRRVLSLLMNNRQIMAYNVPALESTVSDSFYYPTRGAFGISRKRKADIAWIFNDTAQRWPYAFQHNPLVRKGATSDPELDDLNTVDYWEWWRMSTAVGGGPVLLHQNRVRITNREEQILVNVANDRHPRTAIAYTRKNHLLLLVIEGGHPGKAEGATLEETASILRQLHAEEGLNLNGGASSCLLVNGRPTIEPFDMNGEAALPAVFIIRYRN